MKKNVWIFGLIAGLISSVWVTIFSFMRGQDCGSVMGMVYGYTAMIVASSMIFVGIKNYRDKFNNGEVAFGKAFMIGFYISLIASTIYVITWLISYYFFIPDFFEWMSENYVKQMQESGASQVDIDAKKVEILSYKEMYKNPLFNAAFTYLEILPVTLLASLICAAILKRKPQTETI